MRYSIKRQHGCLVAAFPKFNKGICEKSVGERWFRSTAKTERSFHAHVLLEERQLRENRLGNILVAAALGDAREITSKADINVTTQRTRTHFVGNVLRVRAERSEQRFLVE